MTTPEFDRAAEHFSGGEPDAVATALFQVIRNLPKKLVKHAPQANPHRM